MKPPVPLHERFIAKVQMTDTCWLWKGALNDGGYGRLMVDGHFMARAHRVSYELFIGPIPAGLDLDHLCRVRHCVNPYHLEPVTRRENLMRGETIPARNAAKVECPNGHPLSGDYLSRSEPSRRCRICYNRRMREYNARKSASR